MGYIPDKWYEEQGYNAMMKEAQAKTSATGVQQDAMAIEIASQTQNLVKEQLSLSDELETIEHLLRGEILKKVDGVQDWVAPTDPSMVILTEHGVHLIMNTIMFYMNKNTLLSNYTEEIIAQKMEDFSTALADVIFMEYEKVFNYPTFEACKKELNERLERKKELRKFALELVGKEINEKEIKQEFIAEIEGNIEREISKIKEQIIKNKLKRFEILIRVVQDAVHSTYLRAWNGQERRTLRQHITVTESVGTPMPTQTGRSRKGVMGMFRK